jgi:hypothetical protein
MILTHPQEEEFGEDASVIHTRSSTTQKIGLYIWDAAKNLFKT